MSEAVTSKFPELLPIIEEYLNDCKKTGKPMRVHFWDTNHGSELPSQVLADPDLHKLAKKFGSPLYVVEDVTADTWTDVARKYLKGSTEEMAQATEQLNAMAEQHFMTKNRKDLLDIIKSGGGRIFFPDPRKGEKFQEKIDALPEVERNVTQKLVAFFQKESEERQKAGKPSDIANIAQDTTTDIEARLKAYLTPDEYTLAIEMQHRKKIINTTKTDKKISDAVNAEVKDGEVQLMIYGALHFAKNNDLDDLMPGLNIAIADTRKHHIMKDVYSDPEDRKLHNTLPDYVLYADQHRMVKLDNDKAKAEFMGISEEEYRNWQRTINMLDKSSQVAAR